MNWKIPLFKIYWDDQDVEWVSEAIKKGANWATGENVDEFERKIAEYTGTKYAVAVNSGTSALHILLLAYQISKGDEVIVPSFTFIATANAPLFVGAKPVFAEIEDKTYGLDPEDVERKITNKTRAIMPIHFAGYPCLIEQLRKVADKHNILLIEDAAESLGANINGKRVGTFGHSAILSFCQNKLITTGEGGAIITDSKEIYEKSRLLRSHGRAETADYFSSTEYVDYVTLGYNFRMSNIAAALGIAQIKKIDNAINMRRQNAEYMTQQLSRIEKITIPSTPKQFYNVYQMYPIRIKADRSTRDNLKEYLAQKGIMTRVYFAPVHLSQFYRSTFGYKRGELPITEKVSQEILSLPMYPSLIKEEMDYVTEEIENFFSMDGDE